METNKFIELAKQQVIETMSEYKHVYTDGISVDCCSSANQNKTAYLVSLSEKNMMYECDYNGDTNKLKIGIYEHWFNVERKISDVKLVEDNFIELSKTAVIEFVSNFLHGTDDRVSVRWYTKDIHHYTAFLVSHYDELVHFKCTYNADTRILKLESYNYWYSVFRRLEDN